MFSVIVLFAVLLANTISFISIVESALRGLNRLPGANDCGVSVCAVRPAYFLLGSLATVVVCAILLFLPFLFSVGIEAVVLHPARLHFDVESYPGQTLVVL